MKSLIGIKRKVENEKKELDDKIKNLFDFMSLASNRDKVGMAQEALLGNQLAWMQGYSLTLKLRINDFEEKLKKLEEGNKFGGILSSNEASTIDEITKEISSFEKAMIVFCDNPHNIHDLLVARDRLAKFIRNKDNLSKGSKDG